MSGEELRRVEILARVKSKQLKVADAAVLLEVSYRQAKRLWKRYGKRGAAGLKHGNAGRRSNRGQAKEKLRSQVLALVRKKYWGTEEKRFGPRLAAEHLSSEDGLEVNAETVRRWMLEVGLWSRQRQRKAYRKRREPKQHFGELVQMDGSFEEWLEERGPAGCLMNLVDDATGTTLCQLGEQETIWAAARVLRAWVEQYGVPQALYTDWKNVYVREPNAQERLRGEVPVTQFGRMCERLGIRIIAASSPQAKGRVERNHGTHQDRLIKKLRRKQIGTDTAANEFLQEEYLPEHNRRFARAATATGDYHSRAPRKAELDEVFRLETERMLGNDWVVRHQGRLFQVRRESGYAPAQSKVVVCEWEAGRMEIRYRGKRLQYEEIAERPGKAVEPKKPAARHVPLPPPADHPWRGSYRAMRPRRPRAA